MRFLVLDKVLCLDETENVDSPKNLKWIGSHQIISMDGVNATFKTRHRVHKVQVYQLKPLSGDYQADHRTICPFSEQSNMDIIRLAALILWMT